MRLPDLARWLTAVERATPIAKRRRDRRMVRDMLRSPPMPVLRCQARFRVIQELAELFRGRANTVRPCGMAETRLAIGRVCGYMRLHLAAYRQL